MPRPLGHALQATLPNKLLNFDCCYVSQVGEGFVYVLVLKDNLQRKQTPRRLLVTLSGGLAIRTCSFLSCGHRKPFQERALENTARITIHLAILHPSILSVVEWHSRGWSTQAILSELNLRQSCWPTVIPMVQF